MWRIIGEIKIIAMLTSYEIVCATPRRAPKRAYLELENHPAAKVEYTFILERHRKNRAPMGIKKPGWVEGYRVHIIKASRRLRIGANRNGKMLAGEGEDCSFRNSFRASARGCGRPIRATLLGPLRSWKYPSSFRSSRV